MLFPLIRNLHCPIDKLLVLDDVKRAVCDHLQDVLVIVAPETESLSLAAASWR